MTGLENLQIGDRLDMQRGTMIYKGDGKADACVVGADGSLIVKQADAPLSQQMVDAWLVIKAKQAAYVGTRTSATL